MNTDSAFYIGTTHEICQDYTLAERKSIAVSDGCSGSNHSDIGSRVISVTAMNKMAELENLYNFKEEECILLARPSIQMLNLQNECLDATILTAISYDDSFQAMCCGDGVIIVKTKDKDTVVINCAYIDNYPFYMNYLYDLTGRYQNWRDNHNKREIILSIISKDGEIKSLERIEKTNTRIKPEKNDIGILRLFDHKIVLEINDKDSIEFIAIMSDGVHSFYETVITETSKFNKSVPYLEVLEKLLNIKNFNGKFVQRRVNKFRKNCLKNNWSNADDLSLAVIYAGK